MVTEDQVLLEIKTVFRKQKLRNMVRIGAALAALVILYFGCIYTYAATRIAQAKNQGVYPTIEEAVMRNLGQEYGGARVESIGMVHCEPNYPNGKLPFIWFCTARVKMDRTPRGYDKSEWLAGNFYIHVRDGWVFMGEGAFPGFVGRVMELYGMEGVNEWITENR